MIIAHKVGTLYSCVVRRPVGNFAPGCDCRVQLLLLDRELSAYYYYYYYYYYRYYYRYLVTAVWHSAESTVGLGYFASFLLLSAAC